MRPLIRKPSSLAVKESASAAGGGRVINHLPSGLTAQRQTFRAIKIACVTFNDRRARVRRLCHPVSPSSRNFEPALVTPRLSYGMWCQRVGRRHACSSLKQHPSKYVACATIKDLPRKRRITKSSFLLARKNSFGPANTKKATHRLNIERPQRVVPGDVL